RVSALLRDRHGVPAPVAIPDRRFTVDIQVPEDESVVSALAVLTVPGFFTDPTRDLTVMAGILLLAWLPTLPVPRALSRILVLLASASMHIYLVHWLVYPPLTGLGLPLALAASLAAGIAYWALCNRIAGAAQRLLARK
ncbi:MAG: hypothetical protein ACLGIS_08385, partial [Actinomycetes bacterium]